MKILILSILLVFSLNLTVQAPGGQIKRIYVRLTVYSSKQPKEGHICANGKDARNERGIALPRALAKQLGIKFGARIGVPDGTVRIYDDSYPTKTAKRKFNNAVVDVRYYESIKSKPKTKAVNRELCRKFDMGWDWIEIYRED